MAEYLANVFLETLRDLVVEETKFLVGVGADVEKVKRDLESVHALLMKADRERHDSPTLKTYIHQLKDLAFKAENLLETYAVEVQSKRGLRSLKDKFQRYFCIMSECYSVHEVGKEARDIIPALADLTHKLESELGQDSSSLSKQEAQLRQLRETSAHDNEPHFVGMEEDIETLVSKMKDGERQRVVKIYGMGGLGKTTLAKKVYNHRDLQSYARAWVCITQQLEHKSCLGKILKQLDRDVNVNGMEVDELVTEIQGFLKGRKCMVVIDDIWEDDHWEIIKKALPVNCNVILTTRYENIANQQSEPHKLRFLTKDEGWALLQKVAAFPTSYYFVRIVIVDADLKSSIEDIGRQIVSKCEGLPLSICVIGGILRQKKHTLLEWRRVNENMESYLRHGEGVGEYTRVKHVLELSYNALPYYLKPCFLYLAGFSEDEEIETETLYLMWMAEGFISYQDKGRNETLRDVAKRYLIELAMRCMVQLHEVENLEIYSPRDKFNCCKLHDLMHDLCSEKAQGEKFMRYTNASKHLIDIPSTSRRLALHQSIDNSVSRLAIKNDLDDNVQSIDGLEKLKDLRTFYLRAHPNICFKKSTFNFEKSKCLRIFMVEGCIFEGGQLPNKVGKLIHLRYLSLLLSCVSKLPRSIWSLPYLQILDLRVTLFKAFRLPNVIWKMKRLKHLFLPYFGIEVIGGGKLRLDGLEELETLVYINSETCCIEDIPKLVNLQSLDVIVHDVESMPMVFSNKNSQLRETRLLANACDLSSEKDREILNGGLMSSSLVNLCLWQCNMSDCFPCYKQGMCQNLVKLTLTRCKGKVDVMKFAEYPMLQTLSLEQVEMTETLICHSNSFRRLKELNLEYLDDLKKWEVKDRAMPKLISLKIVECPNLEKVPDGLRFISTLRKMKIENMPREFMETVKEEHYAASVKIEKILSSFPFLDLHRELDLPREDDCSFPDLDSPWEDDSSQGCCVW
ncbi:probable disease resistance protein RF45 [Salvia hispanica]|uniref:probable disease resistance protein RF45 n=1 Tax=Salvia hispanica TaxID=49212 RepID=UPI0020096F0C|nr:probable disease resistance protein RF45 [Salvia hispanica]